MSSVYQAAYKEVINERKALAKGRAQGFWGAMGFILGFTLIMSFFSTSTEYTATIDDVPVRCESAGDFAKEYLWGLRVFICEDLS